ncbi:MFS transporter [Phototrophicus methaneseepsis]|uniref:MFS transporter n=1 Tax=Phototrophicus methaneseepsis TaxID=2710758 RepID=A0A7S8E9R3_9CHLR|nr:MFS transporter [Phototrophicus methaneseepsis]QPC82972.1 MFS transporter [Phototrophicus methaneseepsis]
MQNHNTQSAAPAVNPWVVMAFIAIPVFIGSLDLTVVSAFLPELITQLELPVQTALDDASWIVTAYLLAYTVSLTFMGRLSDLLGRRWVYVVCLVVFIIGSIWVAIATTWPADILYDIYRRMGERPDPAYVKLQVIIVGRVVEALGAGALVPVSLALVGDLFPPMKRARPLGLVAATDTLGWVLGPVYGGLFIQIMPWEGLFWMNVPLTLLSLFLVIYGLRHVPQTRVQGRFDFIGTVLIVGALSCLSLGLGANVDMSGASLENLSPLPDYAGPVLAIGFVLFLGFLLVETRFKDPLINLAMFARRNLSAASVVNLLVGYCLFIGLVNVPLLVNISQESTATLTEAALEVGLLLSTLTLPMAIAAVPGGWLSERIGIRNTVVAGLVIALVGFAWVYFTWTVDISRTLIGIQNVLIGVGIGLTFSPVSAAIINSAYDEERGVASALVIILRLIGMTVSVASLSSLAFYRVNALVDAAQTAAGASFDPGQFQVVYFESAVKVLGEMGLIGAVLCGIALVPALLLGRQAAPPERMEPPTQAA